MQHAAAAAVQQQRQRCDSRYSASYVVSAALHMTYTLLRTRQKAR
jgi:hypothetical protein